MKPNLLSLDAGVQVLRTKLFEEGGYDAVIKPHIKPGADQLHPRRTKEAKETIDDASIVYVKANGTTTTSERDCTVRTAGLDPDPIGDSGTFLVVGTVAPTLLSPSTHQTEGSASLEGFWSKQEDYNHKLSCSIILTHWRHAANWNQPIISSDEGDIDFSNRVIPSLPDLDIRALIGGFQANQMELSYKPTCSRILIHQRRTDNWICLIPGSDLRDINFTNRWTCLGLNPATRPKIMLHSPTQQQSRARTTWRMFVGLFRIQQAKDPTKCPSDPQVTPRFLKRVSLVLNEESHPFTRFYGTQHFTWEPGDHLEAIPHFPKCTTPHLIRRIKFEPHLPYMEPLDINHQRLFLYQCCCVLDVNYTIQNVPKARNYLPKLTRYKCFIMFPYFGRFGHKGLTASFSISF